MKTKLILINWILSFMGLSIDTENSSLIAVMIVFSWFMVSTLLLVRAQKRGDLKRFEKN